MRDRLFCRLGESSYLSNHDPICLFFQVDKIAYWRVLFGLFWLVGIFFFPVCLGFFPCN